MAAKPIVLIDTNVILDVFHERMPFYQSSAQILAMAETGKIDGYIAAHSITTLFYILKKNRPNAEVYTHITNLLQFLKIASIDQQTIDQSLKLSYKDFEDAIQMICAVQIKASALISRNVKDFQPSLLPVIQPIDYLTSIQE